MKRFAMGAALLSLAACNEDKAGDTGGTGTEPACDVTIDETLPADGATDAYYRGTIEAHLSEADSTATISLADASGAAVDGTSYLSEDQTVVYFEPQAPLEPSATYTATISRCGGEQTSTIEFTTSTLGEPLSCDLTGRTFRVELGSARFVEPAGIGSLIGDNVDQDVLIGVDSVDDAAGMLTMLGALANDAGDGQDFCNPTIDFPEADFSESPYFIVGPQDATFNVAGISIQINQLVVSGTFASDCSYFGGGVLGGELDARDLGSVAKDYLGTSDPDELCGMLAGFGVTCEACSSDGEPYCVAVLADQIVAEEVAGLTLECVADSDCHPQCDASAENPECDTSNYPTCE